MTVPHEIIRRPVRFRLEGMDAVSVDRDLPFPGSDGEPLALDVYRPPGASAATALPAVVFVFGYPDPGMEAMLGARLKEWSSYQCWARLVAASGMIAVVATNRDPARDARALLSHLRTRGRELGVDPERIGLWACSGNAPNALSLLLDPAPVPRCAALCYGYLLDDEGSTAVVDAARGFFFVAPAAGRPIAALPVEVPLLVVRAGRDETPGLNAVLDRFVARALALDLPIALVNHSGAPHAFDLEQDGETAGPVIRQVLDFLRTRLERARS